MPNFVSSADGISLLSTSSAKTEWESAYYVLYVGKNKNFEQNVFYHVLFIRLRKERSTQKGNETSKRERVL